MIIADESVNISAPPNIIWDIWRAVSQWPQWDQEVSWSRLDGSFELWRAWRTPAAKRAKAKFVITSLVAGKSFTDETKLPLASLRFVHNLECIAGQTRVRHHIEIEGPLAWLFARLLGPTLREGLPVALQSLARQAESTQVLPQEAAL